MRMSSRTAQTVRDPAKGRCVSKAILRDPLTLGEVPSLALGMTGA